MAAGCSPVDRERKWKKTIIIKKFFVFNLTCYTIICFYFCGREGVGALSGKNIIK